MHLVKNETLHMSDAFRKGMWEGKKRIAGVITGAKSEDHLLGLIFVLEVALSEMKRKVHSRRRIKRNSFKLELVK